MIGTGRAADRDPGARPRRGGPSWTSGPSHWSVSGEVDVAFDVIGGESSTAPLGSCAPAAPSSPSPRHRRCGPTKGERSSSSSSPIVTGLLTWLSASATARLRAAVGSVRPLSEAPTAFDPERRVPGKTIIRVTEG